MSEPKPSAWLCEHPEGYCDVAKRQDFSGTYDRWSERPLFTREAIEAEIVAWLRDCTLSSAIPDDPAQIVADLASALESGEYRSKSDD